MSKPVKFTKANFMESITSVCPGFAPIWNEFVDDWKDAPELYEEGGDGTLPHYLVLSELANHLIAMLERGETRNFSQIFNVVEGWIVEGDDYVSNAAVIGLLEDLTVASRYNNAQPSDVLPWLGPVSRESWISVCEWFEWIENGKLKDHPDFESSKLKDRLDSLSKIQ